MDVEPALRFLNAYATHCVWRWERPIEMTFCFEPGPPNCFWRSDTNGEALGSAVMSSRKSLAGLAASGL